MSKVCPVCGYEMDKDRVICEDCEMGYEGFDRIEKRPKQHVVDGGTWWRLPRNERKGA